MTTPITKPKCTEVTDTPDGQVRCIKPQGHTDHLKRPTQCLGMVGGHTAHTWSHQEVNVR